jgi:hypothetical protein
MSDVQPLLNLALRLNNSGLSDLSRFSSEARNTAEDERQRRRSATRQPVEPTTGGPMGITIDDVEALKRELAELPRNQPRQVTKQEAIAMLAGHLGAAKRRGYSPEELANLLSAKGIAINTATLRGYLRRNRKKRGAAGRAATPARLVNGAQAAQPRSAQATPTVNRSESPAAAVQSQAVGGAAPSPAEARSPLETRSAREATAPVR